MLVAAYHGDHPEHHAARGWLQGEVGGPSRFATSELVLSGFLRVVTHPAVFERPSPLGAALEFASGLGEAPNCSPAKPGSRHWPIFVDLCERADARGNLVPDAYLAALAIESGSELITFDRGFGRFPGLRWRGPFDD